MRAHGKEPFGNKRGLYVEVRNGNLDGAIRLLSKMMKNEGMIKDMRKHDFYEKPSEVKRRRKAEARSRMKKNQAKANQEL